MSSSTYHDLFGCLATVLGFALVLAGPGYLVAWTTNLLDFRQRTLGERLTWSVPLSFGVTTVLAVVLSKYGSLSLACWVTVSCGVLATGMIAAELWRSGGIRPKRAVWTAVAIWALFSLFIVGELIDIGIGNKLYMSVTVYDHSARTAFVDAVVRTGVPPKNPMYMAAAVAAPMRYYYFWYVVCALIVKTLGVSSRQAMVASCAWATLGLAAVIVLYCRHFLPPAESEQAARRRNWIAIGLLAATGMDLIPVVVAYLQGMPIDQDMEWWTPEQVTSWLDTMLWVPHHMAALVCCVFGFLLVWMSGSRGWRQKGLCGVIASLGFAASLGISTYVAAAFAVVMTAWLLWSLGWKEGRSRCGALAVAGLISVTIVTPYLQELRTRGPNGQAVKAPLTFSARRIIDPNMISDVPGLKQMRQWKPAAEEETAALLLLAPGYLVELGFFAAALVLAMLRLRKKDGEAERTAIFLTLNGLAVSSFVRSTIIATDDFGIRSMLVPQFFLLLMGVQVIEGWPRIQRRWVRATLLVMLSLGVGGTVYQAGLLRIFLPVQGYLGRGGFTGLAERSMAWQTAFSKMDKVIPKNAVVQYDTVQPSDYFRNAQLINVNRQTVNAVPECAVAFGGDGNACNGIKEALAAVYSHGTNQALNEPEVLKICAQLGIDYLVATRWDAVWQQRDGWVWSLPVAVSTDDVRVVACGKQSQ